MKTKEEGDFSPDMLNGCLTIQAIAARAEGSPMEHSDSGLGRSPHDSVPGTSSDIYPGAWHTFDIFLTFLLITKANICCSQNNRATIKCNPGHSSWSCPVYYDQPIQPLYNQYQLNIMIYMHAFHIQFWPASSCHSLPVQTSQFLPFTSCPNQSALTFHFLSWQVISCLS